MKTFYKNLFISKNNTSLDINNSIEGEYIEAKMRRIVNNNEPITDGAPLIYTDRKDGIKAEFDIRTDRFEIAQNAMDYVSKTNLARRMEAMKKSSGDEPLQATSQPTA